MQSCVGSDVIYTERRGQSQKPEEIYQLIEELVPGGKPPLVAFTNQLLSARPAISSYSAAARSTVLVVLGPGVDMVPVGMFA